MCFINDQTRRGPFRTEPTGKLALDWTHHPEIDLTLERDVIEALPPAHIRLTLLLYVLAINNRTHCAASYPSFLCFVG